MRTHRIGLEFYTLDQLHSIALKQRDMNVACGMPKDGVDYLTRSWIDALVEYQGLPGTVADALRRRLILDVGRPSVQPCGPCAQFLRGVRWDVEIAGVMVHECERVAPSWMTDRCPCGCDVKLFQRGS